MEGPVPGSPVLASSQHVLGGYPAEKSSSWGGVSAAQGVVKNRGPTIILESPVQFACT